MATHVNPTRMELTRLKKKLVTATRGHKLLKDKRDELMRQFLDLVRENKTLREKVEAGVAASGKDFVLAKAAMSDESVNLALMAPTQQVKLALSARNVMSVEIPEYTLHTRSADAGDLFSYGFAFTSADLDDAVSALAGLLADDIEKTRRRVNALEHVMIPDLQQNIKFITMKLDENERSTQIRLMKVKDMMLEQTHHYKERAEAAAKEQCHSDS